MNGVVQPHIQLTSDLHVTHALLPGDPARVDRIKHFLDEPQELCFNREYKSVIGYYSGVKILIISTGIGGPSTGIAVEELANIGIKSMIRIGSCGALQTNLQLGDLIIATGAVRDEGTTAAYIEKGYPAIADHDLVTSLKQKAIDFDCNYYTGVIRSHDSFYTDQEETIDSFWSQKGILGADMETSTLFVLGRLRGLKTASILNVVVTANGSLEGGINNYVDGQVATAEGERRQIKVALEAIASIQHI